MTGSPSRISFIHGRKHALSSITRGGSRMRESRTYGSVGGALSNERPYRDRFARNDGSTPELSLLFEIRVPSLRGAKRRSNPSFLCGLMVCFAWPVVGRAFARPVGSQ